MRAESGLLKGLNPTVTVASITTVVLFVLFCAFQNEQAAKAFEAASTFILTNFKWYYLALLSAVLCLLLYICVSRFGTLKLGAHDDQPEFSFGSWIAMLFSAGMGIGLIFWSVAEPMLHYADNPFAKGLTDEAASMAMRITLFHWGLHPWAIFTLIGLSLAYFSYRKGLPLALRSLLYPLIGDRIYGWIGHVVDIMGVAITAFGVSQSLGLGVAQINTGLHQVFGVPVSISLQLAIILGVTIIASISLLAGLSKGMKRISTLNMYMSILLMLIVLVVGPTRYILNLMFESTGDYVQNLVGLSLWMDTQKDTQWQNWWTAFYWPWWMTWGPFVGLFIARISKGRTIRELIVGALVVPTLVTILWMSVFGGAALKSEQTERQQFQKTVAGTEQVQQQVPFEGGTILLATKKEATAAMFTLLGKLDGPVIGGALSIFVCLLLAVHFVTTADAGTQVLCTLNAMGSTNPPNWIRLLWCVLEGGVAAGLLLAGGLKAIQMASIAAGLPIAVLMMVMSYTLIRSLRDETFSDLPHWPPARLPVQDSVRETFSAQGGSVLGGAEGSLLTARKAS
ncbi:BCCT family transporter [Pseudomonas vancouverensis]|uniref:BCCT family transporter n=1 Tax=Pseudomonas vancouverensis TaxID=95300 RepID=A0A1H2NME1_PSEVA|nr:BCCT family transporter [Pseudomonas vancouverensis]KAB0495307.1 BCCT family transporter [Pseudomonas vancouverensis]TDB56932.1 BCCT family transporter [Pseudomonas vancouverensis]SDV06657.1 choline/carnitine/betaine transport [Pseudomonas vancouverensis]